MPYKEGLFCRRAQYLYCLSWSICRRRPHKVRLELVCRPQLVCVRCLEYVVVARQVQWRDLARHRVW